ncbi:MAG: hypothetical protein V4760_09390 [Bdellovibrionota bacterium]
MTSKFSTFIAAASCALVFAVPFASEANFASDPTRKETKEFTRFFLKRFDTWFTKNAFDFRKSLSPLERAFVDEFLKTAPTFGTKSKEGFLRTIQLGGTIDSEKLEPGPFRFILSPEQSALKPKILELAKARSIRLEAGELEKLVGIGFVSHTDAMELIFEDGSRSLVPESISKKLTEKVVWVTKSYRAGKPISTEALELDVDSDKGCPGITSHSQIDRVTDEGGNQRIICHVSMFEDQAFSPTGRTFGIKVRKGLNLMPGAVDFTSMKRYTFFYP